jgi:hypothetical protein
MSVIPARRRKRQEDRKFEISLGDIVRSCLKKREKRRKEREEEKRRDENAN